jgi:predicted ATPase
MDGPALSAGALLGSYQITARIGAGGMGDVYRAKDTKLKRDVAIKSLPASFAHNAERGRRFQQEAEVLASLNHPNIAAIYDLIVIEGSQYLVLELVDGETLAERLERGPASLEEALQITRQIVAALEAAHDLGIVHRDLKPANIKITNRGVVKLLDFGIAKRQFSPEPDATAGSLTSTGEIVGTATYMSPEQVRGEPVGPSADQFSFGIILFELLTGRRPFSGNSTAEALASILRDKPPMLAELKPGIPAPVQWILDRCLAKQAADRYASTHDLARDIQMLGDRLARLQAVGPRLGPSVLPAVRTSLVGREEELATARSLLLREDVRLVTFTGAGGTGKTRLALQVAADSLETFAGGVFFVALASITDPSLVAQTLAQALGTREIGKREPVEVLKDSLRAVQQPVLLVVDNFEQVLGALPVLTDLLESCPLLKMLVTSRAVLRVYGEYEFEVPPLRLPARKTGAVQNEPVPCPSVALFVQRAAAVKPDFKLNEENATAVEEICVRLDGLPLAIELAAARVRTLTPKAMLQRLASRFDLLTGGARDLPRRQQTLRGAVEWSHELLNGDEQKLFRRLGVFVGGCTLEAVEAVCNAAEDLTTNVLDGMDSLAAQSLIHQTEMPDGETRFTMLETIREYAIDRLKASPDEGLARRAHAAYCLVLAEESGEQPSALELEAWLERCTHDHDNFRAALDWCVRSGQAEWGLRLGAALHQFWRTREHYSEGRERLVALLNLPGGEKVPKAQVRALHAVGDLSWHQGRYPESHSFHEKQIELARTIGDTEIVIALTGLGGTELSLGNLDRAQEIFEESLQICCKAGDEKLIAQALNNVAIVLQTKGQLADAKPLCEQAHDIFVRLHNLAGAAWLESRLGDLEWKLGDLNAARRSYARAVATFEKLGDRWAHARNLVDVAALTFEQGQESEAYGILEQAIRSFRDLGSRRGIALVLEKFAEFAAAHNDAKRAIRLAGAASAVRHSIGTNAQSAGMEQSRKLDSARIALGSSALDIEMDGWSMSIEAAIQYAMNDGPENRG